MNLRATPVLLLFLLATIAPSLASQCADLPAPTCVGCKPREIVGDTMTCTPESSVAATHWFINQQEHIKYAPLECKDNNGQHVWMTSGPKGEVVTEAECHQLCDESDLDFNKYRRIDAPEITLTEVTCSNVTELVLVTPYDRRAYYSITCDVTTGIWMAMGKGALKWPVTTGSPVYCRKLNDAEVDPLLAQYVDEPPPPGHPVWLVPVLIGFGTVLVLAVTVPLTITINILRNRGLPDVKDVPALKAWSEHWNVAEEPADWSWKVLKDFLASWDKRTNEEKIKFIELGYSELGYKSTMTQMLYIFEWMYEMEENHHHVWRPMIICLIRIKRLVTPPFSDPDLMFRFNSWIAFQGKKIIDRYGYFAKHAKRKSQDPHDEYLRFIGVFLMTLGSGARTKQMFQELDAIFLREAFNTPGPVRMAMAASRVSRDSDHFSFERVWDQLARTDASDEPSEWGGRQDQVMYALGFMTDDIPTCMLAEYMLKSKKITGREIAHWFRGANERGHYAHMPFLIKNANRLNVGGKMPIASDEFYECLRSYCLFDRSALAWQTVETFVAKHPELAKRLNVPALRRRSEHFSACYAAGGEEELYAFVSEHHRAMEIEEADFVPTKVTAKPALPSTPAVIPASA